MLVGTSVATSKRYLNVFAGATLEPAGTARWILGSVAFRDGCGSIRFVNPSPLQTLLNAYSLVVLVRVIVSWIQLPPSHPIVHYSRMLTEPFLEPIRKLLPASGGLDFSPLILLLLIRFIARMV